MSDESERESYQCLKCGHAHRKHNSHIGWEHGGLEPPVLDYWIRGAKKSDTPEMAVLAAGIALGLSENEHSEAIRETWGILGFDRRFGDVGSHLNVLSDKYNAIGRTRHGGRLWFYWNASNNNHLRIKQVTNFYKREVVTDV